MSHLGGRGSKIDPKTKKWCHVIFEWLNLSNFQIYHTDFHFLILSLQQFLRFPSIPPIFSPFLMVPHYAGVQIPSKTYVVLSAPDFFSNSFRFHFRPPLIYTHKDEALRCAFQQHTHTHYPPISFFLLSFSLSNYL